MAAARHATDRGRPLIAVPGPVTLGVSVGWHGLARYGRAICVTSAAEISAYLETRHLSAPGGLMTPMRPQDATYAAR